MDQLAFLKDYFGKYKTALFETDVTRQFLEMRDCLTTVKENGNKIIFAGNGASAAISSHCALDFTKQAGINAVTFNESSFITAFSNDYGYTLWIQKALEFYIRPGDVVVLISSSGNSENVVNAATYARSVGNTIITFTGFNEDNPLKSLGDINFWLDSKAYNIIECTHMIWLTTVIDLIIGKAEYAVD
ncbi:MAG: SIS domain-containing protein [bacterium]|nr:SIS domain-containing protein [bacterium]